MKNIDQFLRENKPVVKEDPAFLLETRRRMDAVEGIKAEVDRQRRHGLTALIVTLILGLAVGAFTTAVAFLYPVDPASIGEGVWTSIRLFLDAWKQYLLLPVAALALALGFVLSRDKEKTMPL